jgi:uncharacterized protein YraI
MTIRSTALSLGLGAAIIFAGALPAAAVTAVATDPLNVRTCGSTDCSVVDVLRRGEEVDVRFCEGVWCAITRPGPEGWVNANYLTRGGVYDDDVYDDFYDDDFYDDGEIYIEPRRRHPRRIYRYNPFLDCIGGPSARFCIYD